MTLKTTLEDAYTKAKLSIASLVSAGYIDPIPVSVGDRLQANQGDEVIVSHQGGVAGQQTAAGYQVTHTVNILAFSKSYQRAATMCDYVYSHYNLQIPNNPAPLNDIDSNVVYAHIMPISQSMYYTDSDDFACMTTIEYRYIKS